MIDTNGDGLTASVFTGIGNSNLGRFVFQGEGEGLSLLATNVTCPTGTAEYPLLQSTAVFFFQATGEQLVFTYTSGAAFCFDPTTLTVTSHLPGTFSGGTGRFVHATGTFKDDGIQTFLVGDPPRTYFQHLHWHPHRHAHRGGGWRGLNQTSEDSYITVTPYAASARRSGVGLDTASPVNRAPRGRQPPLQPEPGALAPGGDFPPGGEDNQDRNPVSD